MLRRKFIRDLGISAASIPLVLNLPSLGWARTKARPKRIVFMFSPNGIVPDQFWPDKTGSEFEFKEIMKPLEKFRDKTLIVKGLCDKIRGDGDSHMRGMSCLLTGIELFPGNIQGGSHTPAGWAKGISIDQEIKNFLQKNPETQTRFGSLEFGVNVPDRADPWTRWVYSGPNKPIAPITDPYDMFEKLYGQVENRENIGSILDSLKADLKIIQQNVSSEDRQILEEHATLIRELEQELKMAGEESKSLEPPTLELGIRMKHENMPKHSKMQTELLLNAFKADMARVATVQFTKSVGQARMTWLGIEDGHHGLSHESDSNKKAQEKLVKINQWYCQQLANMVEKFSKTKDIDGNSMLDNTLFIWTNELGKGNSHTLDDIPFVMVGGGGDFKMGRYLKLKRTAHNRLLMSLAHRFEHRIDSFGNKNYCKDGIISELT